MIPAEKTRKALSLPSEDVAIRLSMPLTSTSRAPSVAPAPETSEPVQLNALHSRSSVPLSTHQSNDIPSSEADPEESPDESDNDIEWDNGEPLTAQERAKMMEMDSFSRAEEMKCCQRKRLEEDTSWDNGEPITAKEHSALMKLSWYEREQEMNIQRNQRLLSGIKDDYRSLFNSLKASKLNPSHEDSNLESNTVESTVESPGSLA
jgi:hypothetical protein